MIDLRKTSDVHVRVEPLLSVTQRASIQLLNDVSHYVDSINVSVGFITLYADENSVLVDHLTTHVSNFIYMCIVRGDYARYQWYKGKYYFGGHVFHVDLYATIKN